MAKATHNGTCQACGRVQAVKANGKLAKHGYTVDWGYFNGTCGGSDKAPLEVSHEYTDATVEGLNNWAEKLEAATVENTESITLEVGRGRDRELKEIRTEEEWAEYGRAAGYYDSFEKAKARFVAKKHREAKNARSSAAALEALKEERFGKDLYPRAEEKKLERLAEYHGDPRARYARAAELEKAGWKTRCFMDGRLTATKAA